MYSKCRENSVKIWILGFRFQGLGFSGLGFRVQGFQSSVLGFRVFRARFQILKRVFRARFQILKRVFRARFHFFDKGFRSSIFANLAPKSSKFDEKTVLKLQNRKFFFKIAKILRKIGWAASRLLSRSAGTTRGPSQKRPPLVEEKFTKFSGEPRDARENLCIQPIFGRILSKIVIKTQNKTLAKF